MGALMKRWILFTITLTLISTLALAQAVVTPSGQATTQGAAVPVAPASPPLVTTPLIHIQDVPTPTVPPTGATNSTAEQPKPPEPVAIRPEITLGPANVYAGATAVVPVTNE